MPEYIDFTCRNPECDADLVAELGAFSGGAPAVIAQRPEHSSPAEGGAWSWPTPVVCATCGAVHDADWLDAHLDPDRAYDRRRA